MEIELNLQDSMNFLYSHNVEFITIEVPEERRQGKPYYLWDDQYISVEALAVKLFESNGYSVISGIELRNAYNYISYSREYVLEEHIENLSKHTQFGKLTYGNRIQELKILRKKIKALKEEVLIQNRLNRDLIDLTLKLHKEVRISHPDNLKKEYEMFDFIKTRGDVEIISLIKFFDKIGSIYKGTPDLYIYKDDEFAFIEVKSDTDSLSKWQNCFIHFFRQIVGDNIMVLNIVNDKW
jgi:hypothetical protein